MRDFAVLAGVTLIAAAFAFPWVRVLTAKPEHVIDRLREAATMMLVATGLAWAGWIIHAADLVRG